MTLRCCAVLLLFFTCAGSATPNRTHSDTERWASLGGAGQLCAYRRLGSRAPEPLCFRSSRPDFRCHAASCRQLRSPGDRLLANVLSNGSVLLQWSAPDGLRARGPRSPGGFRLSCRWNGSHAQFECGEVHLASGCRDFLMEELYADVPYLLCLRPLASGRAPDCVELSLSHGGMRDIVVAMTTVGGAICVMLVVICLLVAYITENVINSAVTHVHRTHFNTQL